jgi:hypothetical protein
VHRGLVQKAEHGELEHSGALRHRPLPSETSSPMYRFDTSSR